jgi:hypothetical protein
MFLGSPVWAGSGLVPGGPEAGLQRRHECFRVHVQTFALALDVLGLGPRQSYLYGLTADIARETADIARTWVRKGRFWF